MEVDHIIPESLLEDPTRLKTVLQAFNRPSEFDINSFENWKPSCGPCNLRKKENIFDPSPIIQVHLQQAAGKAQEARELSETIVKDQQIGKAIAKLQTAVAQRNLSDEQLMELAPLVALFNERREPPRKNMPIQVAPGVEILGTSNGITLIKGPYGVGGRPSDPNAHGSFDCPNCGKLGAWNGARCVHCGFLIDD